MAKESAAFQLVRPRPPDAHIAAGAPIEEVVSVLAQELVVAFLAKELVVSLAPSARAVPLRANDKPRRVERHLAITDVISPFSRSRAGEVISSTLAFRRLDVYCP